MNGIRPAVAICGVLLQAGFASAGPGGGNLPGQNVLLHATLDERNGYNDVWGYTAPNGDEYALLGTASGTSVINIVDRENPYETGFIPGPASQWRDIKTYSHYAYVVNETGGGLEIIDLSDPENPQDLANYTGFSTSHNLYVDEATARAYIAGFQQESGGVKILSLANPTAPVEIGQWTQTYFHDVVALGDRLYGSAIYDGELHILDVADPGNISTLGVIGNYPLAFTHNAWMTPDNAYVMTTDETTGASCRMWDVSALPSFSQTDIYRPNSGTIPHNAHIDQNLAVISHYTIGVRIVDVSDPYNLREVGFYDTYAPDDGGSSNGCWGAFPFFPNSPDLLLASDRSSGLFVLEFTGDPGGIFGFVTKAGEPNTKIVGATVEVLQSGVTTTTDHTGFYFLETPQGPVDVEVSAFAYDPTVVPVSVVSGANVQVNVALDAVPGGTLSGTVTDASTAQPLAGATVDVLGTPLSAPVSGTGDYYHGSIPSGSHVARAYLFGYHGAETALQVADGSSLQHAFELSPADVVEEFETVNMGWTVSGNASTGIWERADPESTAEGTQPEDDHTPDPGTMAWITGPLAGSSVGSHDVDEGATILTSPTYDLSGLMNPHVRYWRWYVTGVPSNLTTDFWVAEVSSNGGSSWTAIENTDESDPEWKLVDVAISALVTPTDQVVFRFTAQDTGDGSITEAGLDDFTIYEIVNTTGTGAPTLSNGQPSLMLEAPAPNPFLAGNRSRLSFTLPRRGLVTAAVHDVSGRRLLVLEDRIFEAGRHRLYWDGRDARGRLAPAGVYFVRLVSDEGRRSRKILLLR